MGPNTPTNTQNINCWQNKGAVGGIATFLSTSPRFNSSGDGRLSINLSGSSAFVQNDANIGTHFNTETEFTYAISFQLNNPNSDRPVFSFNNSSFYHIGAFIKADDFRSFLLGGTTNAFNSITGTNYSEATNVFGAGVTSPKYIISTWDKNGLRTYVDGSYISNTSIAYPTGLNIGRLQIGYGSFDGSTTVTLDGYIGEIIIFKRKLSEEEIKLLFNYL